MAAISSYLALSSKTRFLYSRSVFAPKPPIHHLNSPQLNLGTQALPLSRIFWNSPGSRVPAPPVRASVDVTLATAIGPRGAVETDKLPADVRNRTMEAVDACGWRVTIGDVAGRAGLKLNEAQKALQALAADTDGFLEVSDEGDLLYVFPKDYRSKLAAKSFRMKIEPLIDKAKSVADYLIRATFGTTLIASIVLVYTTIIALMSSRSEEDNRGRRGGRSYGSGFTLYFSPTDFLFWDPYYSRRRRQQEKTDPHENMNFIESVFSFVFGDGDPNEGIEEKRWKLIGQYIASNGGVVTAEELAPYLDLQATKGAMDDESYILPVLLRFDGEPGIDEEGSILYRFPSLQRTASSQRSGRKEFVGKRFAEKLGGVDKFLWEKKWQFSKTTASERAMVVGLGGVNLFGVIVLGAMLKYDSFDIDPYFGHLHIQLLIFHLTLM
uniref:Uncharacterized protein MANES_08G025400 n=1 Tax=Rhizophora mucronata TaxID=61149 RepID=A0A2P2MW36_RHIMU